MDWHGINMDYRHLVPKTYVVKTGEELDSHIAENKVTIAGFFGDVDLPKGMVNVLIWVVEMMSNLA